MTALPKHWPSSRRQGRRRATLSKKLASSVACKHCGMPKLQGYLCQNCKQ